MEKKKNFGTHINIKNMAESQYYLDNRKKICHLIYSRAVQIHESKIIYEENLERDLLNTLSENFPKLMEFPSLKKHYEELMKKISKDKTEIHPIIYNQELEDLKSQKI